MNSPTLRTWRERGRWLTIYGHQVFCLEAGDPNAPPLLVLHGFPTSSLDFHRVLAPLAADYRVILHDHLGFGLSDKPAEYSYSLLEQAEVAMAVWRELGVERGHLLAHDYGTSVATEILARRERRLLETELQSVTLCNGSIHLELARLRLSQRIARSPSLGPVFSRLVWSGYFKRVIRRLWGNPHRIDEGDLDAMWEGITYQNGKQRTSQISSYLNERQRFWHRWVGALTRLDLPCHVLWGRADPVAIAAIAELLAKEIPRAQLTWLEGVGHFPMLEDPKKFVEAMRRFLKAPSQGSAA